MILPMPYALASREPTAFVGWPNENIVRWITGPCNSVPVQDEDLFSTDKSRPFPCSAANLRQGVARPWLRAMDPQAREAVSEAEAPAGAAPPSRAVKLDNGRDCPHRMPITERLLHRFIGPTGTVAIRGSSR